MQIILVISLLLASLNAQIHLPHEWDDVRSCNHDENSYYCQSSESCVTDNTNSDYVAFMDVDSGSAECENCVWEQLREDGADCGWNQADSLGQRAGAPKGENTREECLNECYLDPDCTHASFHERQRLCHFFTKCTIEARDTIRWDVYRKVCPRVESEQDEEGSDDSVRPDETEQSKDSSKDSEEPEAEGSEREVEGPDAICNGTEDLCMSYFAYEDMNCGEMNIMESFEAPVNLHKCMDMEDMPERATSIMFSCYMPGVLEKVEYTGTGCTGRGQSTMLSLDECSQDEGGMHTITWVGACLESEDSKEPEGSEREVERPDESEDSEESEDSSKDSEEPEPEGSEKEVEGHDDDLCREYEAMCAKDCPAVPEDNDNKKDVLRVQHGVCVALEGFGSMRVDCDRMGGTATIGVGADCQENVETVRTGGVFCNYETIGATFICEDDYVEIGHCADVTVSMHYQTSEDCNDVVQVENMALDLDECVDGMMCTCGGDDGVVCGSCEEDSVENAMEEHRYVDGEMERLNNGLVVRTRVEGACKDYTKKEDGSEAELPEGSEAEGSDADMGCNERTDACVTITDYLDTCEYGAVLGAETLSVVFGECQTYESNTYIQWECMDGEIVGHTYTDALCREETNKYMSLEYGVCIEGENREFYEAVWSGTCMPSQGSDEGSAQGSDQGSAQGSDQGSAQGSDQGSAQGSDQGSAQGSDQGTAPETTTPYVEPETTTPAPETTTPYVEPETTTPASETTTPYVEPETTTPAPETTTSYVEPETTTPAQGSDQGSAQGSDQGSAQGSAQGSGDMVVDIDELPCVGDEYRDADGMCQLCADHVCPEAGTSPHCENEVVTCVKDAVPTTTVCKMVEVEGRENECAWDEEDKPGRYSPGGKAWSLEDCNDLCVDRDNCSHSAFGGNGNNKDLARCHIFQTCTGTGWHNYVVWEKVCEVVELTPRPTPEPTTRPPTPPPTTVAQCFELKTDLLESRECVWTGQTRDDSMNNATEQNCINLCHSSSSCTHYSYHNKQSRCHTFKSCDGEGEPNSIRWETHTNVCNPANL